MKAETSLRELLAAARALQPYTDPRSVHATHQQLHFHVHGQLLTLTATRGHETAQITLTGGVTDGHRSTAPKPLTTALTTLKPAGAAAKTATVTLAAPPDRLQLTVTGHQPIELAATTPPDGPPTPPPMPTATTLTTGPVTDWCQLLAAVGSAADPRHSYPPLGGIHLLRDYHNTVLIVEATDQYRVHRSPWGPPSGPPAEAAVPIEATNRAIRLLTRCHPHGHLHIELDDRHIRWHTGTVQLCMPTTGGDYPTMETIREQTLAAATTTTTIYQPPLAQALGTATALTKATSGHPRVHLQPGDQPDTIQVAAYDPTGQLMHHTTIPATSTGPVPTLRFRPQFLQQAVAFLDTDHIDIHAPATLGAVYLAGGDRHAIIQPVRIP